ncbi:MAG: hypothetical protein CMH32_02345 [Micavibrio sp.]|mgnify:CR=1 FL=1|nr:hypothetical protein [Micavibrio sp.]HCK32190.1 hypothetical protein [Rhodospirillaceae bacterium]
MIEITPQQIHLWHFLHPNDGQESGIDVVDSFLDQTEIAKCTKIRNAEAKAQFIYSRAFLRNILSQYTGIKPKELSFKTGEWGKPHIAQNTPIKFNLSHTHGLTSIVITNNIECGIDIEQTQKIGQDYLNLAPRIMDECELEYFNTLDANQKPSNFVSIWTIKESYIKTLGMGLSYNLTDIHIDAPNSASPVIQDRNDETAQQRFSISILNPEKNYVGACVTESATDDISYFDTIIDSLSASRTTLTPQRIEKT